jgi:plastocyanin
MKMQNIFLVIALVLLISGCISQQAAQPTPVPTKKPAAQANTQEDNIIDITEFGFTPDEMAVKQGDAVIWVNKNQRKSWPASDAHPTHTLYPDSGINKCGTPEAAGIFDACKGLEENWTYIFVFREEGTWTYHDHLNPSFTGKIVVE